MPSSAFVAIAHCPSNYILVIVCHQVLSASVKMRRVYYVIAPTSSGKTTSSKKLSEEMSLPLYHADLVYNMLADSYPVDCAPEKLTRYELWADPANFGLSSWGEFPNMSAAKQAKYVEMLAGEAGDFIIEGFTLSFVAEREMIEKAVGVHEAVIFYIDLNFPDWIELFKKRNGDATLPSEQGFLRLKSCFTPKATDKVIRVDHPDRVSVTLLTNEESETVNSPVERPTMRVMSEEVFMSKAQQWLDKNPLDKNGNVVGYWKDAKDRWVYYSRISEIISQASPNGGAVLELGSMGMPVVQDSDLMDYDRHLSYYDRGAVDYLHDVRNIPWPVQTKKYDWFIALRVFHHLWPVQRECFEEARRISRNLVLVIPEKLNPEGGVVILPEQLREWNNGVRPDIIEPAGRFGYIYVWFEK